MSLKPLSTQSCFFGPADSSASMSWTSYVVSWFKTLLLQIQKMLEALSFKSSSGSDSGLFSVSLASFGDEFFHRKKMTTTTIKTTPITVRTEATVVFVLCKANTIKLGYNVHNSRDIVIPGKVYAVSSHLGPNNSTNFVNYGHELAALTVSIISRFDSNNFLEKSLLSMFSDYLLYCVKLG